MIEMIDYGGGNVGSMERCLQRLGLEFTRVGGDDDPKPSGEHALLFPGVGAFGAAMHQLKERKLTERLRGMIREGVPYLGVCIGLQVLFEWSEEAPQVPGLGVLPGVIKQFRGGRNHIKIPQIGWNQIHASKANPKAPTGHVYFVNSYHPVPEFDELVLYTADYHTNFCAAAQHDKVTAYQFHPEKSGEFGHQLISDWGQTHG